MSVSLSHRLVPYVCGSRWISALSICASVLLAIMPLLSAQASNENPPIAAPIVSVPFGLPPFPETYEDPAVIAYGAFLFQSPLLSSDRTVACVSCHVPALGLSGPSPTAIGVRGQA